MQQLIRKLEQIEQLITNSGINCKKVLTLEEAALFTGLSVSYLHKLTATRRVPHYKPRSKMIYFLKEELESWLLQNRVDYKN